MTAKSLKYDMVDEFVSGSLTDDSLKTETFVWWTVRPLNHNTTTEIVCDSLNEVRRALAIRFLDRRVNKTWERYY